MGKTRIPLIKEKKTKWYNVVTKPTTDAFCKGKRCESKKVSEDYLKAELLRCKMDPEVEMFYCEEIKQT